MPKLQLKRHEQILQRMIAKVVARSSLSDVSDSSVVKHILSAASREADDLSYQAARILDAFDITTAQGEDLDERAKEIQPATLERLGPRFSVGTVVFSRATNTATTDIIPANTLVKTESGQIYRTTQQTQITPTSPEVRAGHGVGRDSDLVSAVATVAGEAGDVAPNTVVKFVSKLPNIHEVTNLSSFNFGRTEESDDDFRQRLKSFVNSLSTCPEQAIEFIALGIEDTPSGKQVVFSHVFEDPINLGNFTLYIDDGAGTAESSTAVVDEIVTEGLAGPPSDSAVGGEEFLYLDEKPVKLESAFTLVSEKPVGVPFRGTLTLGVDYFLEAASGRVFFDPPLVQGEVIKASYTHFTGLIQAVQKVIDGDKTDRINFPGKRAAGTRCRVLSPIVVNQNVTAVLTLLPGYSRASVVAAAKDAVSDYINTLGISGDVVRNELIDRIMGVDGVYDVNLTVPLVNVPILDNQIARILVSNINIT